MFGSIGEFGGKEIILLLALIALFCLYYIPFSIAVRNKSSRFLSILLMNTFLGWTIIGWIIAYKWATEKDDSWSTL